MQFRTKIPIQKGTHLIDHNSGIVSIGSCFAVNIAAKLDYFKFRNTVNPFGILFHPLAIEKFIDFAINEKVFTMADIFFHNERWHCFDAHSDISCADQKQMLENLNAIVKAANQQISEATHIVITLGTAWVYQNIESRQTVANCHKLPQQQFDKKILSVDMISKSISNIISQLKNANSKSHIIFTVSPVRHLKDGFTENQLSKSNLIAALHHTLENQSSASYFPSYEIMMDELRDYRFYAEDMIHPNQTAIDYIWERFSSTWISEGSYETMKEIGDIQKALAHKPFNADSESHQLFCRKTEKRIADFKRQFPQINF